ncbi:hypothetical protein HDU76_002958 [Blyttiomyces sp. JEL0837]|nr:hypothetical protein HDU76_002958 [Blyttiomyces sp. JEL0837]
MRPAFSDIIRSVVYPNLRDGENVKNYPEVLGIQSNLMFCHHTRAEGAGSGGKAGTVTDDSMSKINKYEVAMVVKIVDYLLKQRQYSANQIVVLTPYLGQVQQLRKTLSSVVKTTLSELDADNLIQAGVDPADGVSGSTDKDGTGKGKGAIRISSVDNYQGEESEVIVASLVRSNSSRDLGFLGNVERVNVLMSRAKHGLIIVGDMVTLENARSAEARELWQKVLGAIRKGGIVTTGFAAVCPRHPDQKVTLEEPEEFDVKVPNGGCSLICSQALPCSHTCKWKCHGGSCGSCKEKLEEFCAKGLHKLIWPCGKTKPANCNPCDQAAERARQEAERQMRKALAEQAEREKYERELAQMEAEAAAIRDELQRMELENAQQTAKEVREAEIRELKLKKAELQAAFEKQKLDRERKMNKTVKKEASSSQAVKSDGKEGGRAKKEKKEKNTKELDKGKAIATSSNAETTQDLEIEPYDLPQYQPTEPPPQVAPSAEIVTAGPSSSAKPPPSDSDTTDTDTESNKSTKKSHVGPMDDDDDSSSNTSDSSDNDDIEAALTSGSWNSVVAILKSDLQEWKDTFDIEVKAVRNVDQITAAAVNIPDYGWKLLLNEQWADALDYFEKSADKSSTARRIVGLCRSRLDDDTLFSDISSFVTSSDALNPADLYALASIFDYASTKADVVDAKSYAKQCSGYAIVFVYICSKLGSSSKVSTWKSSAETLIKRHRNTIIQKSTSTADNSNSKLSEAQKAWQYEKDVNLANCPPMDELMKMIGLESVKMQFIKIFESVQLARRQGKSLKEKRFNIRLLGNPGTGKTTVSRIFGKFLTNVGALTGTGYVETTGARLVNEGVNEVKKLLDTLLQAGGGVLFIDEFYQLDPQNEIQGRRVLDYLLPEIENNVGKIVVAVAGYQNKIEKVFEYNEGLPSRFPHILVFEDYSDSELLEILQALIKKDLGPLFTIEDGLDGQHMRILARRIGRRRGVGFGNAREVQNVFQQVRENQAHRIARERKEVGYSDDFLITREDLLGPDPVVALEKSQAYRELQDMIGLKSVKDSVKSLVELVKTNVELEKKEKPLLNVALNRLMLGSPGTGKTTVAGYYGRILKDLGLLSNGEVVIKKPSDFIGSALGESEKNTRGILQATVGKVLVIDEAYGLHAGGKIGGGTDPYKTAVIDAIVGEIQNVPGEDRCVLMLGYREQMEEMMTNSNPGLSRRFAIDDAFIFDDFTDDELWKILNLKLKKKGLSASFKVQRTAIEILKQHRRRPNFGNGGAVENLISTAIMNMANRQKLLPPHERALATNLESRDFDPRDPSDISRDSDPTHIFSNLIGCEELLNQMLVYKGSVEMAKAQGKNPMDVVPLLFRFVGPPGTGKTSAARKIGRFFHGLGILGSPEVVEISASELIGQYVGHTGPKVLDVLRKAGGKVLFIYEAYRLNAFGGADAFAREAVDELVDQVTKPEFHKKIVIILAGYKKDIDRLMSANSGLASRFSETVEFKNLPPAKLCDLLLLKLHDQEFGLENFEQIKNNWMVNMMEELSGFEGFGNGRDVETMAKEIIRLASTEPYRVVNPGEPVKVSEDEVLKVFTTRLARAQEAAKAQGSISSRYSLPISMNPSPSMPLQQNPRIATTAIKTDTPPPPPTPENKLVEIDEEEATDDNSDGSDPSNIQIGIRDIGVTDEIWQQVLEAQRKLDLQRQHERDEQERLERERIAAILLAEKLAREKKEEEARKAREEAERKRKELERAMAEAEWREKELAAVQAKLKRMGVCCMGYQWLPMGDGGYRCAGGSHYISAEALK